MNDLVIMNPFLLELKHKINLDEIHSITWNWDVQPVWTNGHYLPKHIRDRFQYLTIEMKNGIEYKLTKDTITDEVEFYEI